MPAPKPSAPADWDTSLSNLLMPSGGQIAAGWSNGQVVPSNWLNWFMNLVGQWTDYLNDFEIQAHTWTVLQTFTASGGNQAILATSSQAQPTIQATNSAAGSAGIAGVASGAGGSGISASANVGTGAGGSGLFASSNDTAAWAAQFSSAGPGPVVGALNIIPQATPSAPTDGDTWIDSTLNALAAHINSLALNLFPQLGPTNMPSGSMINNFSTGGGVTQARYYRDASRRVSFSGEVTNIGAVTNTACFTLPSVTYWPTATRWFRAHNVTTPAAGAWVSVASNGIIGVTVPNANDVIALDGINYETF